jgi:hypothetical protein
MAKKPIEKTDYEKRVHSATWNFLFFCALTVINIGVLLFEGNDYYISSSSFAIHLLRLGKIYCGKMDNEFYVGKYANIEFMSGEFYFYMIASAVIIAGIFLLLWWLSKKHYAFMIVGFILILADTIFMIFVYEFNFMTFCDYAIHTFMMVMIALGVHASIKLKRIKADEEAFMASVKNTHRDMFR